MTFFVFTYNQEETIGDAVDSALNQDHPGLEIIVSDDCSTDDTVEVVLSKTRQYSGPHRVLVRKNPQNLGLVGHVNLAFSVSSGRYIVFAAGDDISMPNRARMAQAAFMEPERAPLLVHSWAIGFAGTQSYGIMKPPVINRTSTVSALTSSTNFYLGPTLCADRELWDLFGDIQDPHAVEDLIVGFRGELLNRSKELPVPLVSYRLDSGISSKYESGFLSFREFLERQQGYFLAVSSSIPQMLRDLEKNPTGLTVSSISEIRKRLRERQRKAEFRLATYSLARNGVRTDGTESGQSITLARFQVLADFPYWLYSVARRFLGLSARRARGLC